MPSPNYRYLVGDLIAGTEIYGEIPFEKMSYGDRLNAAGFFDGTVDVSGAKGAEIRALCLPGKRSLFIERDGLLVWGGIIWKAKPGINKMRVAGAGFWSYFHHRAQAVERSWSSVDQTLAARTLINDAQAVTNGTIGVATPTNNSGVLRADVRWPLADARYVAELIEDMAVLDNGFDFAIVVGGSPGAITKTFTTWHPQRGTSQADRYDYPSNLIDPDEDIDAESAANKTIVVGAGEGKYMIRKTATDATAAGAGYPLLERILINKGIKRATTAQAVADRSLRYLKRPLVIPRAEVLTPPFAGGSQQYAVGDKANYYCVEGGVSMSAVYRLAAWRIDVDENYKERIFHEVVDEAVFT